MKKLFAGFAACAFLLGTTAHARANMNICEEQVEAYTKNVLNIQDPVYDYVWGYQNDSMTSVVGVRSAASATGCDEYVITLRANYDECHRAHYGSIDYISYVKKARTCH